MPSAVRAKHSLDTKHLQNKRYRSCFVFLSLLFFASYFSIPNRILYLQKSIVSFSSSSFSSVFFFFFARSSLTIQYPNEDENESRRRETLTHTTRTHINERRRGGGGGRSRRNKTRQSGIATWLDPGVHGPVCLACVYTTREKPNVSCTSDHHKEEEEEGREPWLTIWTRRRRRRKVFHLPPEASTEIFLEGKKNNKSDATTL